MIYPAGMSGLVYNFLGETIEEDPEIIHGIL